MVETKYLDKIFKAIPSSSLLLVADAPFFTIANVNTAYLNATGTKEVNLIGQSVFDTFPYSTGCNSSEAVINLRKSLLTVVNNGKKDLMATQKFEFSNRGVEKIADCYWDIENIPILDNDNNIAVIIHFVIDSTERILENEKQRIEKRNLAIREEEKEIEKRDLKRLINSTDEKRFIQEHGYSQANGHGELVRLMGTTQDITERKKAENQLAISENQLTVIYNTVADVIFMLSVENDRFKFISVNHAFLKTAGLSASDVIGQYADNIIPPSSWNKVESNYLKAINTKSTVKWEETSEYPSGLKWGLVSVTPVLDDEGNCFRLVGAVHDITELEKAALALTESNERFEYVTRATFDAIWDWDIISDKVFWGEGFVHLFGEMEYDLTDIERLRKRIHPSDINNLLYSAAKTLKGADTNWSYEHRYLKTDGTYAFVSNKAIIVRDGQGKAMRVVGAMQDITVKKELENLLNKATSLARIGSWELDLVKNSLYWSTITKEIHEVDWAFEPQLETAINFYKEGKNRDLMTQSLQKTIEYSIPFDIELQIITANKNEKWIRAIGESECVESKCVKVYGSFQDIDVRKKAELAVIDVLNEKNTILESIGDAFFAIDKNWKITYWNKQAEILLQKKKSEVIDHYLWEIFSDSVNSDSYKQYHLAINTNHVVHFEDHYMPLNKWYEVSAYPSDSGLSVYFKDITERKLTEISLNELNKNLLKQAKELAISNADLEQFAYVASHDLQEPLRMVTSFLTLLEKKYENIIDAKGKKYIDFAVDGARRMRRIILDLLEFSRVGRTEDKKEDVNLNELVKEVQILFRKKIEEKRAVIQSDDLPVIYAHLAPLRQIFHNIIGNAFKYSKEEIPPRIEIFLTDKISHWQFAIKDNGIGIAAEDAQKIFIIFQRLHTNDKYSGTGMGLAVTKKIVENYGGKIWLESEEGTGSIFYFTILKQP